MGHVILCGRCKKPVELITFTIDLYGTIYNCTAEEGMTFEDWAASSYNTTQWKYWHGDSPLCNDPNNNSSGIYDVTKTTVIQAGATYNAWAGCFVAGTRVLIDEVTSKPIEEFVAGDKVLSYNVNTNETYIAEVQRLIVNTSAVDMANVLLDNSTMLTMSACHPVYTKNGFRSITNYNGYDTLVVGDVTKTIDGWSKIVSIDRYLSDEPITVYTLAVRDIEENPDIDTDDTYFANGVVVHNKAIG